MMPSMMSGSALLWVIPGVLFCLTFLAAFTWLFTQWLKNRNPLLPHHAPQPQDQYRAYEQGYRPEQRTPETYEEGGQQYLYPQEEYAEQPRAHYP